MATLKQRLHRKSESGSYDVVHLESDATVIKINSDDTETKTVADYLPKIQDTDDTPTDINPGQIIVGQTKVWFCGGDGETYELTSQGGGPFFPSYGKTFTYTGEYQIIDDSDDNWKIKFITSGTFVAKSDLLLDIFAVGGGGGGGNYSSGYGASGGGGGYTTTQLSQYIEKNKSYEIIIGDGGEIATMGGNTSGFNVTANGGYNGTTSTYLSYDYSTTLELGGRGGSGGGSAYAYSTTQGESSFYATNGGTNGGKGGTINSVYTTQGAEGQGTTTKEFAEDTGTLYAGGGAGYMSTRYIKTAKGGAGGGGDSTYPGTDYLGGGGGGGAKGGAGILIIRNHRE